MEFLSQLEQLGISQWVITTVWGEPLLLCAHAIGMGIVVGLLVLLSVRILGGFNGIPISAFQDFMRIATGGFLLNAASGVLLFMANATRLIGNTAFQVKIALIICGGISVLVLWRTLMAEPQAVAGEGVFSGRSRAIAVATIVFWTTAVVAGRLIAYVDVEAAYA